MFASTCFGEESIERVIASANCLVAWHLTVRLNSMLEAEELPASIANLNASLSEVKAKSFTHCVWSGEAKVSELVVQKC
jgi:hypothetical protein